MAMETTGIHDDKSQYCIPFILERLEAHRQLYARVENAPPFFLGLNGVQGAGKTVLVRLEACSS
jgi:D-glycerate 3-kinase